MTYAPAVNIPPPGSRTIDQLLAEARARLNRVSPQQAVRAAGAGALLSCSITGITRRSSSASGTGSAPGRVDSAPMSMMAAPAAIMRSA